MGTYCTTTSLQSVMYGVDFSATGMSTMAAQAIKHAEAEVNKYLSKRYDLSSSTFQTSTSIPPIVTAISERMAEGFMWKWLSRGSKESVDRGNDLLNEARANLLDIANYKVDLLSTIGAVIPESSTATNRVQCSTSNYSDTFGEDDELEWAPDSDKIDDIATSRD